MVEEEVWREGLLDHRQAVLVEPKEVVRFIGPIGAVGIDLQDQVVSKRRPDRRDRLEVPARLDLQLHAPVAGVDVARNYRNELLGSVHDPNHDADADPFPHRTQVRCQRTARGAELRVENRHLDRCPGHVVSPDRAQQLLQRGRSNPRSLEEQRDEESAQDIGGPAQVLAPVRGRRLGHAFAPALGRVAEDADEERLTRVLGADGAPEGPYKRHRHPAELHPLQPHGVAGAPASVDLESLEELGLAVLELLHRDLASFALPVQGLDELQQLLG